VNLQAEINSSFHQPATNSHHQSNSEEPAILQESQQAQRIPVAAINKNHGISLPVRNPDHEHKLPALFLLSPLPQSQPVVSAITITSSPAFKSPVTSQPCCPRDNPLKLSRCSSHSYDLLSLCGEENEKKERRIEK
jgi:hypothetical protein